MEKLLTVVIPAYNAEKYITYTLDSLCAGCRDRDLKKKIRAGQEMKRNQTFKPYQQECLIFNQVWIGPNTWKY